MSDKKKSSELQVNIENIMRKTQYEHFDEWVTNFALNLPQIWKEKSAKELVAKNENAFNLEENSAIIIGRGPSINRHNHLKILADSDYQGTIVCCDGKLSDTLNAGVTPDKFKKFFVITIDPYPDIKKHYDNEIIDVYGSKIKGLFSVLTNISVMERVRESGIEVHWMHSLFDYNEGKKSFNNLSALMIRAQDDLHRLPAIQTGGNVGTSAWFAAWKILGCDTIALTGINHGWEEEDSWEKIISHGNMLDINKVDKESPAFKKLFRKIHNPDFDCMCILDPLFQFYSEALKEFILRSPEWLKTINSTEGGSIFGERIKSMKFIDFLNSFRK
jgi:hypothetical protein